MKKGEKRRITDIREERKATTTDSTDTERIINKY